MKDPFRPKLFLLPLALLAPLAAPAAGQDRQDPAKKEVVRERTVYVPYQQLESVFEKEGRGVFLPYQEFLKLWQAGQPKPPVEKPELPPAAAVLSGGSYTGSVSGEVARFTVSYQIEALKAGWSEVPLPLRGVAVESVELSSPRALFAFKDGQNTLLLPEPGRYAARLTLAAPVQVEPGKKTISFGIPPIAVSRLDLTIPGEELAVEVQPALAVTRTAAADKSTQVLAFLGNSNTVTVSWMLPAGKGAEGAAVLIAEQSLRVLLGERILRISTDLDWQLVRGEAASFRVNLPAGMRLLSVKGDDLREWREEDGALLAFRHSPLKAAAGTTGGASWRLSLVFERILDDTPPALAVPFPSAAGVSRESGWVVLSQEPGLNVRINSRAGLSQLDREEIPEPLRTSAAMGFRYLAHPLSLELGLEKVLPVVRSSTTSVMVLGQEEDAWIGWIDYSISRAGIFRLQFRVPARWGVASAGDPAAGEVQDTAGADGLRTVTVNLKAKVLGDYRLPFRLTAPGSAAPGEAALGPPVVVGSDEDRGLFAVSAPRAIELLTLERRGMVTADVDALFRSGIMGQVGAGEGVPLTYRYRESSAAVSLRLVARKTEVDLLAQHLIEIGDGAVRVIHLLDFQVLFAAADRVAFTAPAELDQVLKVEAREKKEVKRSPGAPGRTLWEVILQAPALGSVPVTVTQETELKAFEEGRPLPHPVAIPAGAGVRSVKGYLALQKTGTLEIAPQPAGMEPIDAGELPDKLRRGQIYAAFRYFTGEPSLTLALTRYRFDELPQTVVSLLRLKSVLGEDRKLKTRATLLVQNSGRQYLELGLPPGASIFSISVAGKPEPPRKRREGAGTLISLPSAAGAEGTFPVVLVYQEPLPGSALGLLGGVGIETIEVLAGVPVIKVELDLYLPPDYAYLWFRGNLKDTSPEPRDFWSRLRGLGAAAGGSRAMASTAPAAPAPAAAPAVTGEPVDLEIPTGDCRLHRFETLAPVGRLRFAYLDRGLYSFTDFLFFVAALSAGLLLSRRGRRPLRRLAVLLVFLPLALVWFSSGASAEIATAILLGGALAWSIAAGREILKKARQFRARRLPLAPDPYLEEGP